MKTSTYLKQARSTLGLKQGDMAKLLGVRQVNLCKYELDYTIPPGDVILRAMELIKGKRNRKATP
jgi:predicted transcriptional regulator